MVVKALKHQYFGKCLKEFRNNAGLSQKEVGEMLGYTNPQFVSNWERGISTPPVDVLKKLSQIYSVPSDKMFSLILDTAIERVTLSLKSRYYGKKSI